MNYYLILEENANQNKSYTKKTINNSGLYFVSHPTSCLMSMEYCSPKIEDSYFVEKSPSKVFEKYKNSLEENTDISLMMIFLHDTFRLVEKINEDKYVVVDQDIYFTYLSEFMIDCGLDEEEIEDIYTHGVFDDDIEALETNIMESVTGVDKFIGYLATLGEVGKLAISIHSGSDVQEPLYLGIQKKSVLTKDVLDEIEPVIDDFLIPEYSDYILDVPYKTANELIVRMLAYEDSIVVLVISPIKDEDDMSKTMRKIRGFLCYLDDSMQINYSQLTANELKDSYRNNKDTEQDIICGKDDDDVIMGFDLID